MKTRVLVPLIIRGSVLRGLNFRARLFRRCSRAVILPAFVIAIVLSWSLVVFGQGGTGRPDSKTKSAPAKKTSAKTGPKSDPATSTSTDANKAKAPPRVVTTLSGIELVLIPAGSFVMGSVNREANERPTRQVTFKQSFYLGRYEVTQAQWQAVMGSNPATGRNCTNCPVEEVSWDDTQNFINKLNQKNDGFIYRLPTEAEWEYACRAGTRTDYAGDLMEMAWYSENSMSKTHPVGGKQLNAWGLADMHGNVWEWCEDVYHETYYGAPEDGSAWLQGGEPMYRIIRGGGYNDDPISAGARLRSAYRGGDVPGDRSDVIGFRLVAIPQSQ